jgi:glutaredoxin
VVSALKSVPVAVFGRTTCPYTVEAVATLENATAGLAGSPVTVVWADKAPQGAELWAALKTELGVKTVPLIFINGEFVVSS